MKERTYVPSWWNESCNELSNNDSIMKSLINKFNDNKNFPIGKKTIREIISLPIHQGIRKKEITKINDCIKNFYNEK